MKLLKDYSEESKIWKLKREKGDVSNLLKLGLQHWQIALAFKGQADEDTAKIFRDYYLNR